MNWNRLLLLCALASLVATSGCVLEGSPQEQKVGTVSLPLRVESNGYVYQLMNANITVIGTQTETYSASPSDAILELTLSRGDYLFRLEPDWQLRRVDQAGATEHLDDAVLTSANPMAVTVDNQQTVQVLFSFDVSGEAITFGDGEVEVGIEVCDGEACTNSLPGQTGTGGGASGSGCLEDNPTMTPSGSTQMQFGSANVSRNGVPYRFQANGWGSGWSGHDISWIGSAMTVNSLEGFSENGTPVGEPTVGCGLVADGSTTDCGLPRLLGDLESLAMGLRWTQGSGDDFSVRLEALLGSDGNTLDDAVARIAVVLRQAPDQQPVGSLLGSTGLAGQSWEIWGGTASNLSMVTYVPTSGQSNELEIDMTDFFENLQTTINFDRVLGASMAFEAFGPVNGLSSTDFCVQPD